MTLLSAIVATSENNVIGLGNQIPWHIPEDFKHFKRTTMGNPLIMGRKTLETLPGILPGRPHIVITRQDYHKDGVTVVHSIEDGIKAAKQMNDEEVFIIGGAEIYKQSLPLWDRLYLTRIHKTYDGDAFFPEVDISEWIIKEECRSSQDDLEFTFYTLDRR